MNVSRGSITGLHERRLAGSTIHEIGLPESGYSPPAPHAALRPLRLARRMTAEGRAAPFDLPPDSGHPRAPICAASALPLPLPLPLPASGALT